MVLLSGAADAPLHARSSSSTAASPIVLTQEAVQKPSLKLESEGVITCIITHSRENMQKKKHSCAQLERWRSQRLSYGPRRASCQALVGED